MRRVCRLAAGLEIGCGWRVHGVYGLWMLFVTSGRGVVGVRGLGKVVLNEFACHCGWKVLIMMMYYEGRGGLECPNLEDLAD